MTPLHLINHLNIGGRERLVTELANEQLAMGLYPIIACLKNSGTLERNLKKGITVLKLGKKMSLDLSAINKLKNHLQRNDVDVLHIHNPGTMLSGVIAGKLAKTKRIIVTEHGFSYDLNFRERLKNRFLYNFVDKAVAVSESVKERTKFLYKIPQNKSVVIYNGIYPMIINEPKEISKRKLNMVQEDMYAIAIGRLVDVKNHANLIRSFHIVSRLQPRLKLWIVGEGPKKNEYYRLLKRLNIEESVFLAGERFDINRILNAADLFILPSFSEGLSITLLEAISSGLPVIVSNVGGNREVIEDKKTGILIDPHDVEGMAEAILKIESDFKLRNALAASAKEIFYRKFIIQKMAVQIAKIYTESNVK